MGRFEIKKEEPGEKTAETSEKNLKDGNLQGDDDTERLFDPKPELIDADVGMIDEGNFILSLGVLFVFICLYY